MSSDQPAQFELGDIDFRENAPVVAAELARLYERSGLRRPTADLTRIGRMILGADLSFTAWHGARLVGVARCLTDFCHSCYLADLAVDRQYQRRGIGRGLLERVQARLGEQVMILLLAAPEAADYYRHVGFEKVENGWRIPRRK
jgi:GNAT superfamily N-acetyltransferase